MTDKTRDIQNLIATTDKTVFNTDDLNKFLQYENYRSLIRRINYLNKTGKIIQLKRGLYSIRGRPINEFELANKIRTPSYISFETVLLREGIIFQWDNRITLAGNESIEYEINGHIILFRQLKQDILLNKNGVEQEENYFIASKERALLDMLYINPSFQFDNLRNIDFEKIDFLLTIYNRKNLVKIVKKLKAHAQSY